MHLRRRLPPLCWRPVAISRGLPPSTSLLSSCWRNALLMTIRLAAISARPKTRAQVSTNDLRHTVYMMCEL